MTVKVTKPEVNLREELAGLKLEKGVAGLELLKAETDADVLESIDFSKGVVEDFESTGIDDNATSTAVTISDTLMTVGRLQPKSIYPTIAQSAGTSGSGGEFWKLGRINLSGSLSAKIRVGGTQSYSAGGNISGETTIHLRGNNATTTLDGHFYGSTKGNATVADVCYINVAGNEFDIYIRTAGTYSGLDTWVDCAGSWTSSLANTGSTTAPSGSIALPSYYAVATNGSERMRIDPSGRVTTPNQPSFAANYDGNSFTVSANTKISQNRQLYDTGNCFDPNNSRFNAPVAGRYLFTFHTIFRGNYTNASATFKVNGTTPSSTGSNGGMHHHFTTDAGNHWYNITMNTILDLDANDYVEVWNGGLSVDYHGNSWNRWTGMLLG